MAREKESNIEKSGLDIRTVRGQRKSAVSRDIDGYLEDVWEISLSFSDSHKTEAEGKSNLRLPV